MIFNFYFRGKRFHRKDLSKAYSETFQPFSANKSFAFVLKAQSVILITAEILFKI